MCSGINCGTTTSSDSESESSEGHVKWRKLHVANQSDTDSDERGEGSSRRRKSSRGHKSSNPAVIGRAVAMGGARGVQAVVAMGAIGGVLRAMVLVFDKRLGPINTQLVSTIMGIEMNFRVRCIYRYPRHLIVFGPGHRFPLYVHTCLHEIATPSSIFFWFCLHHYSDSRKTIPLTNINFTFWAKILSFVVLLLPLAADTRQLHTTRLYTKCLPIRCLSGLASCLCQSAGTQGMSDWFSGLEEAEQALLLA